MRDEENTLFKLGNKFRKAREAAGLTQLEVAEKAEINVNYYAQVERGEVNVSYEKIKRIAKVLKIKTIEM